MPLGSSVPTWPGDPQVAIEPTLLIDRDGAQVSQLALGSHSGTHVDAPAHLVVGGKGVGELDVTALMGPALVVYLPEVTAITMENLQSSFHDYSCDLAELPLRLLLKTRNSDRDILAHDLLPDYVALTIDAAEWLVAQGIILVGIDALSVDLFDDAQCSVHRILLAHDTIIVEGLDLREVSPGLYDLICLPLRIPGGDGAPARAVLVQ